MDLNDSEEAWSESQVCSDRTPGGRASWWEECCREGRSALFEELWHLECCAVSLVELRSGALVSHRPGAFPAVLGMLGEASSCLVKWPVLEGLLFCLWKFSSYCSLLPLVYAHHFWLKLKAVTDLLYKAGLFKWFTWNKTKTKFILYPLLSEQGIQSHKALLCSPPSAVLSRLTTPQKCCIASVL